MPSAAPFLGMWIGVVLAVAMGVTACLQGTANGLIANRIGLGAAVLLNGAVFVTGAFALWLVLPRIAQDGGGSLHPIVYAAGLLGVFIVAASAFAFPRLGAGPTTVLLVAAQLTAAMVFDISAGPSSGSPSRRCACSARCC